MRRTITNFVDVLGSTIWIFIKNENRIFKVWAAMFQKFLATKFKIVFVSCIWEFFQNEGKMTFVKAKVNFPFYYDQN